MTTGIHSGTILRWLLCRSLSQELWHLLLQEVGTSAGLATLAASGNPFSSVVPFAGKITSAGVLRVVQHAYLLLRVSGYLLRALVEVHMTIRIAALTPAQHEGVIL